MKTPPPPLLVSFESIEHLFSALDEEHSRTYEAEIARLHAQGLPPAVSPYIISTMFGVSVNFIQSLIRKPERHYRSFRIRKGKKIREINAPKVAIKLIQKWIGSHLASSVRLPESVFGFIPGKNGVVEAAQSHCEAKWVFSVDLRDFFSQVSSGRIEAALVGLGYSERSASVISRLCTFRGVLPQGSPASPVLSNIAFMSTDEILNSLALKYKVQYSRYADDLVFSGKMEHNPELKNEIIKILGDMGWVVAADKVEFSELPRRLRVHGLLVHGAHPRLTKGYRNRIRALRHLLAKNKIPHENKPRALGHISYAESVESFCKGGSAAGQSN